MQNFPCTSAMYIFYQCMQFSSWSFMIFSSFHSPARDMLEKPTPGFAIQSGSPRTRNIPRQSIDFNNIHPDH